MSKITRKVLTSKTVWSHVNDKKFRWTHLPQDFINVNLNDFTNAIMKAYTDHQISYNQEPLTFKGKKLKSTREMFSKHIRGRTQYAYKLYIVDPPNLIKQLEREYVQKQKIQEKRFKPTMVFHLYWKGTSGPVLLLIST